MEEDETERFQQRKERQFIQESRRNKPVSVTKHSQLEDVWRSAVGTQGLGGTRQPRSAQVTAGQPGPCRAPGYN